MTSKPGTGGRLLWLTLPCNLVGAVLTFLYFRFVDPSAHQSIRPLAPAELVFFVVSFGVLAAIVYFVGSRWLWPVTRIQGAPPPGPAGDEIRRRALRVPEFLALISLAAWGAASIHWGVVWPLLSGGFSIAGSLRQIFGILFVAGTVLAAIVYFIAERIWRTELPRLFPAGDLSAVAVRRQRVRTRMIAVFLLTSLVPLSVLSVAALTRARDVFAAEAPAQAALAKAAQDNALN